MRIQGEGHYYTDANGYQTFRIRVNGQDKTRKAKTLALLKPKVKALLKAIEGGPVVDTSNPTVSEFLTEWLQSSVKPSRSSKTYRQYEQIVRLYISPAIGLKKLKSLTFGDCQAAVNSIVSRGLSPQTAVHVRNVLRRSLSVAMSRGLIKTNPVAGTEPPKMNLREKRAFRPEEIRAFYTEAFKRHEYKTKPGEFVFDYRLGAVLVFLTETGLRVSELLGLKDVDFDEKVFRVARKLERSTGESWSVQPLKTKSSTRVVPMSETAKAALVVWRGVQRREREKLGEYWREHGFAFTAANGEPLFDRNLQRTLDSILSAANLGHYSLHDLRRTFGTTLANAGTPIHVVGSLMGHADIKTTLNHYNTTFAEDKAKAVNSISDFQIPDSNFENYPVRELVSRDSQK